jgi:uncharacterized protein
MLKPRGPICNLDCAYCYYLEKEGLFANSRFRMHTEVLETFIRQYIEAQPASQVTFAWQGGEPGLMGLPFYRKALELQQKYARPGMVIENTFQTNGILLNEEWATFFRQHNFLVGLSLDGPQAVHDAYRVDKGGRPTFDRVFKALRLLQKYQVDVNILACVQAASAGKGAQIYRFFRDDAEVQFLQFIPIVTPDPDASHSIDGERYGAFLIEVFNEWVRKDVGRMYIQLFDVALAAWVGAPPGLCVFNETCGNALVMEHNGDLFSCDHFVDPNHRLGNILEQALPVLASSVQQLCFGRDKRDSLPGQCRDCEVRFVCQGGCPKDRILITPEGEPGLNYLCGGYRPFFNHIREPMQFMAAELRARRAPANVMNWLASRGKD